MTPEHRHRALVEALVAHRIYAYTTSAVFRSSVDTLARMLPAMVDGLAQHAEGADEEVRRAITALELAPGPGMLHPDTFSGSTDDRP